MILRPAGTSAAIWYLVKKFEQSKQSKHLLTQNHYYCTRASYNPTFFCIFCLFWAVLWLWKPTNASLVLCGFSSELQQQMTPSSPTVTAVLSWMGWTPMTGKAWTSVFSVAGRAKAVCFLRRAVSSWALDSCSMYAHRSPFITKRPISLRRRRTSLGRCI